MPYGLNGPQSPWRKTSQIVRSDQRPVAGEGPMAKYKKVSTHSPLQYDPTRHTVGSHQGPSDQPMSAKRGRKGTTKRRRRY